jgi:N-acetylated-alpha-linked acidic dipeptidase
MPSNPLPGPSVRQRLLLIACFAASLATPAAAQQIAGFSAADATRELALDARLQLVPDTTSARVFTHVLAGKPHVAGTPAQIETANYVLTQMKSWGLDTSRVAFRVYMPYHDSTIVERITPTRQRLDLSEPPIVGDPTTALPNQWPAMNGNSGAGDVTAPLVYVNYGLPTDYQRLDSLGISVKGKVAIARYGQSFRGIKAREAESHGAVALLIYSDPQDDGFVRGPVYPEGPYRPAQGVQRGSIYNGDGDPTTPGWASTANARRVPEDSLDVAHIPVVPIGYGNADSLMKDMGGPAVPSSAGRGGWQGGMTFPYHLGDGSVKVRVAVWPQRGAKAYKNIYDTFGTIRGSEFPNEMVIIGGHRDAWGPGADDNVSGTVSIMEAAHAWGDALKAGIRPKRTIVFATWDAEEWGLVGSTEWVELKSQELKADAVAYINEDESAAGTNFSASGTASLQGMLRDATKVVRAPVDTGSVYARWSSGGGRGGRGGAAPSAEPRMGDLGGGSDFGAFYNGLGIPSLEFGFGGSGGGIYHSAYDTYTHMERFGDPGYLGHAAAGRVGAVLVGRLADADIIPYDFSALGAYLGQLLQRVTRDPSLDAAGVADASLAMAQFDSAGRRFDAARDAALTGAPLAATRLAKVNADLRKVELQLTRPQGLVGRPFMKNLVFASDRDNGYANIALPSVAEALRDHNATLAGKELSDLAAHVRAATAAVNTATSDLR